MILGNTRSFDKILTFYLARGGGDFALSLGLMSPLVTPVMHIS